MGSSVKQNAKLKFRNVTLNTKMICKVNTLGSRGCDMSIVSGIVQMINQKGIEIRVFSPGAVPCNYFVKWVNIIDYYSEEVEKLSQLGL